MPPFVLLSTTLLALGSGIEMSRIALTNLLTATGGRAIGLADDATFGRVEIDSRRVRPGDLFWAIRGDRHDGHDFVARAFDRGAAGCVVADATATNVERLVVVSDTRRALGDLARSRRADSDALVVGITGSVGKTTTRELVYSVLAAEHTGLRSPRNFNNDIGLPLTLLGLDQSHDFAVVEIAASAPGEIAALAAVARPDVAVVTRVAPAHLAGFGSIDAIAEEKAALVGAVDAAGFVVLNGDDPLVRQMAERTSVPSVLVGTSRDNDLCGTVVSVAPNELVVRVDGLDYVVPATGRHHLVPILAAIAVGREIGLSAEVIAEGLRRYEPVDGRSTCERIGDWIVVDDTYNASPASMQAACELLTDLHENHQTVLVAGDMLELGDDAENLHADFGRIAAESKIDHLLLFGAHAERVAQEARQQGMDAHRLAVCSEFDALLAVLDCTLEPGAVVLAKGSRGMRMERVVRWLQARAATQPSLPTGPLPARAA